MWALFNRSLNADKDPRKSGLVIGLLALFLIASKIDYDSRTGWHFVDRPFGHKIVQVTKEQTLSMIKGRQIKTYGVHHGQILMSGGDGKWYSLSYFDNHDVVRQLGQDTPYVGYYDRRY